MTVSPSSKKAPALRFGARVRRLDDPVRAVFGPLRHVQFTRDAGRRACGYTATDAGLATAWSGVTALFLAPWVAQAANKRDPRMPVVVGVIWMGLITLWRTVAITDMGFWDVAFPLMAMCIGLPFFFIPTTGLALASVEEHEMDSAAGLMNFLRTLSGAFATSLVTSVWSDQTSATMPNWWAWPTATAACGPCWATPA